MVMELWKRILLPKLSEAETYTPDMFVKCQWQKTSGVRIQYLIYRWILACIFCCILTASILDLGRPQHPYTHYAKWPIYLTHWGFLVCTIQALLAAVIVTQTHWYTTDNDEHFDASFKMKHSFKVYWILHTIGTVAAFAITSIYWTFVFDPEIHIMDALNILVHGVNSVLMLLDLCLVAHPVRFNYFYWPVVFSLTYMVFSAVYYLAGGTDRLDRAFIYNILDWRYPVKTLLITTVCLGFVIVLHSIVCLFSLSRRSVARYLERRKEIGIELETQCVSDKVSTTLSIVKLV